MRLRPLLFLSLAVCSSPTKEICNNGGLDDDMNGVADCFDTSCALDPSCQSSDGGFYGPCAKCGQSCTKQQDCFGTNLLDDRPLAQCKNGRCQQFNQSVQLKIEYNTSRWGGVSPTALGAITTRWISKTAADGTAVTCEAIKTAAPANNMPLQLEASGKFAVYGLDVTKVAMLGGSIPDPLTVPYAYTGAVSDYIVYTEAWAGNIDSTTRLPTGQRRDAGCVDTGNEVAPITTANDCRDGGGTCRTLKIPLPGP